MSVAPALFHEEAEDVEAAHARRVDQTARAVADAAAAVLHTEKGLEQTCGNDTHTTHTHR